MRQLKGRSFEQQPAPHRGRSFLDDSAKYPVELGPALVGQASHVFGRLVAIQRIQHHTG
jgi:hypothetical protein